MGEAHMELLDEGIRFPHIGEILFDMATEAYSTLDEAEKAPAEVGARN
jgi:hypothetical protein